MRSTPAGSLLGDRPAPSASTAADSGGTMSVDRPLNKPDTRGLDSASPRSAPLDWPHRTEAQSAQLDLETASKERPASNQAHPAQDPFDHPWLQNEHDFPVYFRDHRSLLRRCASLQTGGLLETHTSDAMSRTVDGHGAAGGPHQPVSHDRCLSSSGRERPLVHARWRLRSRRAPWHEPHSAGRRTSHDRHGQVSSPSALSWVPTAIRVEKRSLPKATLWSAVFLCLVVAAAFVLLLARKTPAYAALRAHVCSTDDCLEHARRLLRTLNASADPCRDFHSYVCEGDDASAGDATGSRNGAQVRHVLLQPGLEENHTSTATMKAFIALEKCSQRSADDDAVGDLAQFMAERGIPWPAQPTTRDAGPVQLLDVLLDLSINWRVALWFDVSAAYSDIDGSFVVTVSELGPLAWHRMRLLSELNYEDYASLVRNMSSLLTNGTAELGGQDLVNLRRDEIAVRSTLLSLEADDQHDAIVPLHKIGDITGVISSDEWIALLKKRLLPDLNISSHTEALLSNKPYLARIFAVIGSFPAERVLNVAGWMFAYVYAWAATSSFDGLHSTAAKGIETYALCFLAVQESFGIAHVAASFVRRFIERDLRRISDVLNRTAAVLVHAITDSQSVSNSTKTMAATKIQAAAGRHFWPPEPFFHLGTLDALYDSFPVQQQDTFFAIWLKSRKALRASLTNRYYGSLMTARYSWPLGNVLYVYSHNCVRVALWAFYPPSYLTSGSSAMTYSGLGFRLARALVRAVDEHGRRFDHVGREKSWWEQTRKCKWDLAQTGREKRMIADLFALEVALNALKSSSGAGYGSRRIRGLESLSEAQTFFVSFCSHYCDDPEGRSLCSLATNSSEFAEAFSCEMPQQDRCLFV